ncbi:MAG: gas vesicle protein GvpD P-loop domain-containing protein [Candidatus Helarchaeota archaeon]
MIPPEIESALNQSYGFVLLVKGKAGVGKTTFAFEALRLTKQKNPIYISTRVNPDRIFKQFPWIVNFLKNENVIDARSFDFNSITPPLNKNSFLDSLKLQNLPDFIKILFSKLTQMDSNLIVIDSWDAISAVIQSSWGKSDKILAGYLLDLLRQKEINLIIIEETDKESYLDYLADGIVCLSEELIYNRLVRQIYITKLRGIRINQPIYLFTLEKGHFTAFLPEDLTWKSFQTINIIEDSEKDTFSTGIQDLDQILSGGFPKGSMIIYEIHPSLSSLFGLFSVGLSANFILQDRGILVITAPGRDINFELTNFKNSLDDPKRILTHFRVIEIGKERSDLPKYVYRVLPKSNLEYFLFVSTIAKEFREQIKNAPLLVFFSLDTVSFNFPVDEIKRDILRVRSEIKKTGNLLIIIAKIGDELIEYLARIADMHFVFNYIHHKLTLFGKNPETPIYAIQFNNDDINYNFELLPIV